MASTGRGADHEYPIIGRDGQEIPEINTHTRSRIVMT